jgi:hypothetical protein
MDTLVAKWHREYMAVCSAEQETLAYMSVMPDGPAYEGETKPYDADIKLGELRGLPNEMSTHQLRLPIVAVLQKWDDRHWLVAPFSPVDIPATRGEFTIADVIWGGALQVWNAMIVPALLLRKSWSLGSLTDEEALQARFLFRELTTGVAIPPEHQPEVGPALTDPADPRMEYQKVEKAYWQPLRDRIMAYAAVSDAWDRCLSAADGNYEVTDNEYLYSLPSSVLDRLAGSPEVSVLASYMDESADEPGEQVRRVEHAPDTTQERSEWLKGKTVEEIVFTDANRRHRVLRKTA